MTRVTILDGGMGRELERIGAPFSQPLWSAQALIESPHYVSQAHQSFIDAGAEIIITNSYACVPFHLGDELFVKDGAKLAEKAAKLARSSADSSKKPILVAGCLPPAMGSYRPDLFETDKAQAIIKTLIEAQQNYVDLWLVETIASIEEFNAIASLLTDSEKPCYYAFTLSDEVSSTPKLRSGELVQDAISALIDQSVQGVLFNCSIPEVMECAIAATAQQLHQYGKQDEVAIGAYANAFTPITDVHQANDQLQGMRTLSPAEYLNFAQHWKQAGATIIGGCCGIGPEHIEQLNAHLNRP